MFQNLNELGSAIHNASTIDAKLFNSLAVGLASQYKTDSGRSQALFDAAAQKVTENFGAKELIECQQQIGLSSALSLNVLINKVVSNRADGSREGFQRAARNLMQELSGEFGASTGRSEIRQFIIAALGRQLLTFGLEQPEADLITMSQLFFKMTFLCGKSLGAHDNTFKYIREACGCADPLELVSERLAKVFAKIVGALDLSSLSPDKIQQILSPIISSLIAGCFGWTLHGEKIVMNQVALSAVKCFFDFAITDINADVSLTREYRDCLVRDLIGTFLAHLSSECAEAAKEVESEDTVTRLRMAAATRRAYGETIAREAESRLHQASLDLDKLWDKLSEKLGGKAPYGHSFTFTIGDSPPTNVKLSFTLGPTDGQGFRVRIAAMTISILEKELNFESRIVNIPVQYYRFFDRGTDEEFSFQGLVGCNLLRAVREGELKIPNEKLTCRATIRMIQAMCDLISQVWQNVSSSNLPDVVVSPIPPDPDKPVIQSPWIDAELSEIATALNRAIIDPENTDDSEFSALIAAMNSRLRSPETTQEEKRAFFSKVSSGTGSKVGFGEASDNRLALFNYVFKSLESR